MPAGTWQYVAALNDGWIESYGQHAQPNGANIILALGSPANVKFYYNPNNHWITDQVNSVIAVAPGSFQSEIGCPGDWQPDCLRSWLQDPDGDGVYTYETQSIPAGNYEFKIATNETWDINYGAGGVQGGANVPFFVPGGGPYFVIISWNSTTHVPTVLIIGTQLFLPLISRNVIDFDQ